MKKDTLTHRSLELLSLLRRVGGTARNAHIAQAMDVSEETVRRLVKSLAKSGLVERVHGGTYLLSPAGAQGFSYNIGQQSREKTLIAIALAEMIQDEMTLFLDVGSTSTYVAEHLRARRKLTVVTNSVVVTQTLANHNSNRVFLAGGEVRHSEHGAFGSATEAYVRGFRFDMAILSANAVNQTHGFLVANPSEADLARTVADQAVEVTMVIDSEKFSRQAPFVTCPPQKVTRMITDTAPHQALSLALAHWGVDLIIAGAKVSST